MKKISITFFLLFLLTSVQCFATYTIIESNSPEEQKKYNEVVEKITPQTLGLKPTTDFAEYSQEEITEKPLITEDTEVFINNTDFNENIYNFFRKHINILKFTGLFIILSIFFLLRKRIAEKFSLLPHGNYHILGCLTTVYLLFITIYAWDNKINYGYYEILRWAVSCFAFWSAYRITQKQNNIWFLIFMAIGILFNPIVKIVLDKDVWQIIDIIVLVFFISYFYKNEMKKKKD